MCEVALLGWYLTFAADRRDQPKIILLSWAWTCCSCDQWPAELDQRLTCCYRRSPVPLSMLTVVHVGDIHHPSAVTKRVLDEKDRGFPQSVTASIATSPLQESVRELSHVVDKYKPAAILFSGDLTDRGTLSGYQECVKYLENVFEISKSPEKFHVVPGNHDVDRSLANTGDLFAKFHPLATSWQTHAAPILTYKDAAVREITKDRCSIMLCELNSCIGCGETRAFPQRPSGEADGMPTEQSESLDTPAFDANHITAVDAAIRNANEQTVPLVLAHHNLLPQRIPRIAPYSEVLNAGHVRGRLSGRNRPVIYCHGHTHDEPVEVVQQFAPQIGTLISISAPELQNGFNLIRIYFNPQHRPLGCGVERFQRSQGILEPAQEIRITFCSPRDFRTVSPLCKATFSVLSDGPQDFQAIKENVRKATLKKTKSGLIAQALEELEWCGLLQIYQRECGEGAWLVRRTDNG